MCWPCAGLSRLWGNFGEFPAVTANSPPSNGEYPSSRRPVAYLDEPRRTMGDNHRLQPQSIYNYTNGYSRDSQTQIAPAAQTQTTASNFGRSSPALPSQPTWI